MTAGARDGIFGCRVTRSVVLLSALALAAAVLALACGENTHVYAGRLYVESRDCLGTTSSIEVVEGDPAGTCTPRCLVQRTTPDGGRSVYVSTMCAPYPFGFDTDGADPRCASALAALGRNDTCLVDGGSTAPAPRDAGADAP